MESQTWDQEVQRARLGTFYLCETAYELVGMFCPGVAGGPDGELEHANFQEI